MVLGSMNIIWLQENSVEYYSVEKAGWFIVLFSLTNRASEFPIAEFLIMMYECRKDRSNAICFRGVPCVSVMMVGFGAMLIPSWLFCNNSGEEGGGVMERHHFTPPIPLRHHWNIIRCLLTFKSCSAAVISIGPAAISVKCPLATLLLHMEDFLSPSMVSLLYFAPSLHLAFYPPCPLKPDCDEGWEPLALRK